MAPAASALVRVSCVKVFEAAAKPLPELKRARGAFAMETAYLEPREAANKDRPARTRHNATISQGERPIWEGRADDGSPLQKESMLSGDPDPILTVMWPAPRQDYPTGVRGLPCPTFLGVSTWAQPTARCVTGAVGKPPASETALRGLPVATLVRV